MLRSTNEVENIEFVAIRRRVCRIYIYFKKYVIKKQQLNFKWNKFHRFRGLRGLASAWDLHFEVTNKKFYIERFPPAPSGLRDYLIWAFWPVKTWNLLFIYSTTWFCRAWLYEFLKNIAWLHEIYGRWGGALKRTMTTS